MSYHCVVSDRQWLSGGGELNKNLQLMTILEFFLKIYLENGVCVTWHCTRCFMKVLCFRLFTVDVWRPGCVGVCRPGDIRLHGRHTPRRKNSV